MSDPLGEALTWLDEQQIRPNLKGWPMVNPPDDMSLNEKQAWKEGWMQGWIHQPTAEDWITCPTCNGSGVVFTRPDKVVRTRHEVCPDCVDGLQPSPELIERAAQPLAANDGIEVLDWHRDLARAVLLASRQGDTP